MRKYQQLLLFIISCISVCVLFIYKTENSRLKDVLQVINFFGRNHTSLQQRIKSDVKSNLTQLVLLDFLYPIAVWQAIGNTFHVYSAYWIQNGLLSGGEAVALVIGRKGVKPNFKCLLKYETENRIVRQNNKFRFQHIETFAGNQSDNIISDVSAYLFYFRTNQVHGKPVGVTFINSNNFNKERGIKHTIKLRYINGNNKSAMNMRDIEPLSICLDLTNYYTNDNNDLLEFFVYHYYLGVKDFIIYNSDALSASFVGYLLNLINIRLYSIPYNFPYTLDNDYLSVSRALLEMDCLLRNTNRARHTLLLRANEFFYSAIEPKKIKNLYFNKTSGDNMKIFLRYELNTFAVCKNQHNKYLIDNYLYDSKRSHTDSLFLYSLKSTDTVMAALKDELLKPRNNYNIQMPHILAHRYVNCQHVGIDGLHDWSTMLGKDFKQHLKYIRDDMKSIIP